MSEFQELIKSFSKSRDYVRDFFVYGFKTREDFSQKSGRTYDNERRRIESWLADYIQSDYHEHGKTVSIVLNSNLLLTNPLYRVWKSKSFTDNDIMLHFFLMDILKDKKPRTIDELTNTLFSNYDVLFEPQIIRKKVKEYEKEGLLTCEKSGKQYRYLCKDNLSASIPNALAPLLDAIRFYHMTEPLGIVGSTILDNHKTKNDLFTTKHSFFVHTLEDEILLDLLTAMQEKKAVCLTQQSTKNKHIQIVYGVPLKIFVSTKTGRRYICLYIPKIERFNNFRLDSIKKVKTLEPVPSYEEHKQALKRNLPKLFGVSFGNDHINDRIKLTLSIDEEKEHFILERLKREGKGGILTRIDANTFTYEREVFDGNEMMPWIKTFIGKIIAFESNNDYLKGKFYHDIRQMIEMYR